jgi:hypothetical protein
VAGHRRALSGVICVADASPLHYFMLIGPIAALIVMAATRISSCRRRCRGGPEQLRHPSEQRCQCRRGLGRRLDDQPAAGGVLNSQT